MSAPIVDLMPPASNEHPVNSKKRGRSAKMPQSQTRTRVGSSPSSPSVLDGSLQLARGVQIDFTPEE